MAGDVDTAAQDAARLASAETELRRVLIRALRDVIMLTDSDTAVRRRLVAADLARWTREEQRDLDRLAWKYRRRLPRHLAPRLNPDDPIVRGMAGG
jgi:hypothetical protein